MTTTSNNAAPGWTTDLVKRLLIEGGRLDSFNSGFVKIVRRNPVQALSADPLKRFFQEGAPEFRAPALVPFDVAKAAAAELGAVQAGDTLQHFGRVFGVRARFRGEHYVNQANSYMVTHPDTSLLAVIDGEAIIALNDDKGTPAKAS